MTRAVWGALLAVVLLGSCGGGGGGDVEAAAPQAADTASLLRCRLTPSACPLLQLGEPVTGTVAPGEQNWYAIQLSAGQPYRLELEGSPTGQGTLEDPLLRLVDDREQPLTTDDDSGVSLNARIVCAPSNSGLHFVSAGGFEGSGSYRLSVSVSNVAAPDCASIVGDGRVDWESPFSGAEIVSMGATLAAGQVQGGSFSISGGTQPVDVIFAAQQTATLHVTTPEGLAACTSGGAFTPYATFTGQAAAWTLPLEPGNYGLCVRNMTGVLNPIRLEIKKEPTVAGFHFSRQRFATVAQTINAGGRFAQPATTGIDYRTLIEGANTGGTFHIIDASDVQNFLEGRPFNHYPELTAACIPAGAAAPELCELKDVEDYNIVYHNDTANPQSIVIIGRDYVPD
jgi:hypothetical protein